MSVKPQIPLINSNQVAVGRGSDTEIKPRIFPEMAVHKGAISTLCMHVLLLASNDADDYIVNIQACVVVCHSVLGHKYSLFIFPRTCLLEVSVSVRRRFPRLRVELARARRHREI